jgi:hypothetical protein
LSSQISISQGSLIVLMRTELDRLDVMSVLMKAGYYVKAGVEWNGGSEG